MYDRAKSENSRPLMSVITHFTLRPFNLSYIDVLKIHIKEDTLLIHFPARAHSAITLFPPSTSPLHRPPSHAAIPYQQHHPPSLNPPPKQKSPSSPPLRTPTTFPASPHPYSPPCKSIPFPRRCTIIKTTTNTKPPPAAQTHLRIRGTSTHHLPPRRTPT